jgi:membrane protease YdiL (CAAX protease family)
MLNNQTTKVPAYLPYQKKFTPYKWYKPLLAMLVAFGFFLVFSIVLSTIGEIIATIQGYDLQKLIFGGYDTLDAYTPLGAILSLGGIAVMLPAVFLGNKIINARPFSSISSSRGGFDFAVFFKCFAAGLMLIALPMTVIGLLTSKQTGEIRFTVLGFILCTVLVPLQCIAEEYVFRGQFMTMFGAWIKFPIIPILLQTIIFAAAHPYNIIGVISVAMMGVALSICACITKGLEASCALHIINNMVAFYFTGFGFEGVTADVQIGDLIISSVIFGLYIAFIIFANKKLGWFNRVKKDDAAEFNAKIAAKQQAKTEKYA